MDIELTPGSPSPPPETHTPESPPAPPIYNWDLAFERLKLGKTMVSAEQAQAWLSGNIRNRAITPISTKGKTAYGLVVAFSRRFIIYSPAKIKPWPMNSCSQFWKPKFWLRKIRLTGSENGLSEKWESNGP